jgi:hypothetical protein
LYVMTFGVSEIIDEYASSCDPASFAPFYTHQRRTAVEFLRSIPLRRFLSGPSISSFVTPL